MTFKKQVQFSRSIEWIDAFDNDEYDRTAQKVATLSYRDMYELMVLKSQWRQESEMHEQRAMIKNDCSRAVNEDSSSTNA